MVTMADLMCLLLSFFVMLFTFAHTDIVKFKGATNSMKEALGAGQQRASLLDLTEIPTRADEASLETRTLTELRQRIAAVGLETVVKTQSSERGAMVRVNGSLLFDDGSDELHPEALIFLDEIAKLARSFPYALAVEGHTDGSDRVSPRFPTHWDLSAARAIAAARYLVEVAGTPRERVSAAAFSDARPLFPNDSPEHRDANRRVEFVYQLDRPAPAPPGPPPPWVPEPQVWSAGAGAPR
jgi:chemotaxis protein MotB